MNQLKLRKVLEDFLLEDIGDNDLTSNAIFSSEQQGTGTFVVKANGVIAGLSIIDITYKLLHPDIKVSLHIKDGDFVKSGEAIATVSGPIRTILTGERVILNLLQRMSGIATMTSTCIETLDDPSIQICDTRKTTPGLRMLERYAVVTGGGKNHRNGLYDGVMIKDNHISYCGSIISAVEIARASLGHMVKIEVETETKEQVLEAVKAGADVIMFDNRTPNEVKDFTKLVPSSIITEASGGISLDSLSSYAGVGVQYISLGALTHSVKSLDISLNVS